jgi:glycosyltransferase involved in cell wall biosynthesis
MDNLYISIVIPAYNEETNIRLGALDKVSRYLDHQAYTWEAIIVNDGSSDQTGVLIEEFVRTNKGFRYINNPHQGKAATVITGVLMAKGTYVLFSDLDQATPLKEIEKILPWFEKGFDVVIGSRKDKREGAPILRRFMARGFMFLRTFILGLKGISDTQCGFKGFRKEAALNIIKRLELYGKMKTVTGSMVTAGFDIEILFLAKTLGYTIKEVPVEWHYVETRRVNPITDSWQGFMDILQIQMNAWKGRYQL